MCAASGEQQFEIRGQPPQTLGGTARPGSAQHAQACAQHAQRVGHVLSMHSVAGNPGPHGVNSNASNQSVPSVRDNQTACTTKRAQHAQHGWKVGAAWHASVAGWQPLHEQRAQHAQ